MDLAHVKFKVAIKLKLLVSCLTAIVGKIDPNLYKCVDPS